MKKSLSRNYKKIKLRKVEEKKLSKKRKRLERQYRAEAAINIPINWLLYAKRTAHVLCSVVLCVVFFVFPFQQLPEILKGENSSGCVLAMSFHNRSYDWQDPYASFTKEKLQAATVKSELHKQIIAIVKNTPMERMANDIAKRDRAVAAFIVGIGMKESKFGIYSPKKNGVECYNYWGYRGKENTTDSGYSCFDSPSHAVKVVGNRIERIVKQGAKNPAQMISWKCGSTCAGHSKESVDKWIQDVAIHYYGLNPSVQVARK